MNGDDMVCEWGASGCEGAGWPQIDPVRRELDGIDVEMILCGSCERDRAMEA